MAKREEKRGERKKKKPTASFQSQFYSTIITHSFDGLYYYLYNIRIYRFYDFLFTLNKKKKKNNKNLK